MAKFQRHIFTCTHVRSEDGHRGCCAAKGSDDVAVALKRRIHEAGLKRIVRASTSGCLDQCARGTTLVVYPEGIWYGGVAVDDVDEIVTRHIIGGEVVERLRISNADLTGRPWPAGQEESCEAAIRPLALDGLLASNPTDSE